MLKPFDWMKVPPLWFCARKFVENIALSTPVPGYKPSKADRSSYSWAHFEDHYTSLTSQGAHAAQFFPMVITHPVYHPHPPGLNFGEQKETSVSLCCLKPLILHLCFQLAIPHAFWG